MSVLAKAMPAVHHPKAYKNDLNLTPQEKTLHLPINVSGYGIAAYSRWTRINMNVN